MIIAVDFDGTLCMHEYPEIGEEVSNAIDVCKELMENGHKLILWTMRGNKPTDERDTLKEAVNWCAERGLNFWGVNENPDQKASGWSMSNKQYAGLYIDDAALGCPLDSIPIKGRPFVHWVEVRKRLVAMGAIVESVENSVLLCCSSPDRINSYCRNCGDGFYQGKLRQG